MYKIIKVYGDSRSDPISMKMTKMIKFKCDPPFEVILNYEVKDWLTNELNSRDSEVNESYLDSFIKVPINEDIPLSINITSISEKALAIKNIDLDIVNTKLISKASKNPFTQVDQLEEGDSVSAGFVLKALDCSNDTGQYGDVLIEWFRISEFTGKVFRNICRVPTTALSIVSSPL
jgi:hypothetical protein